MASNMKPLPKAILIAVPIALMIWAYTAFDSAHLQGKEPPDSRTETSEERTDRSKSESVERTANEAANKAAIVSEEPKHEAPPEPNSGIDAVLEAGKKK